MVLVLLGASMVLFVCLFIVPGDPVATAQGEGRRIDPATLQQLHKRYNLDKPLPVQYVQYVNRLVHGDMGQSIRLRRSVNEYLRTKVPNTFKLAGAAIVALVVIGMTAGLISALTRYSFWDVMVTLSTTLAIGFPTFVIGLFLQHTFAIRWHLLPLGGQKAGFRSIIMPAFTLASVDAAIVARLMRGTMLEVLRADYIRTAQAKGLSSRVVVLKHALRNSIIPVITYLGISFGSLLGGALITENIFNWDGVGLALVTAIQAQDNPIVLGIVIYSVAVFVVVNLVVDVAYAFLDPRIRLE